MLYVQLQQELKRALYASNEFYDYAMYYPQTKEMVSANYGYFQLSREKNKDYRLAYNIDNSEDYHWGLNVAVPQSNNTDILLTVTYKFDNGTMLIYGLGKEYFDSFFVGNTNREGGQGGLFILDNKGSFIYSDGISPENWIDIPNFSDSVDDAVSTGSQHISNNSSTYILTVKATETLPFKIGKINRIHFLMGLKNYLLLLGCLFLLITIAILAGIVIPNYFMQKVHKPISKLASHIEESSSPTGNDSTKLLQKIDDYVINSKNELQEIRHVLDSSRDAIKDNFIKSLFHSANPDAQSIQEYTKNVQEKTLLHI